MILPTKHLTINESLIGCGGTILKLLNHPMTISAFWDKARRDSSIANYYRFSLILTFLFMLDVIDFRNGLIMRKKKCFIDYFQIKPLLEKCLLKKD